MTTAEAVAAKLQGTLKKFTLRVLLKDGRTLEIQTDEPARIDYDSTVRDIFLTTGYSNANMVRMSDVSAWITIANAEPAPDPIPPTPTPDAGF